MKNLKKLWMSIDEVTRKALCFVLSAIMLFESGYLVGAMTNINGTVSTAVSGTAADTGPVQQTVTPITPATDPVATEPATSLPQTSDTQSAPQSSTGTFSTTAEVVELFNEAVNKVKTDATKVTKNFEKRNYDEANSVVPSALSSLAARLMDTYMADDTEPIEYATKEDIIANYQVPGESYCSKLTAADVVSATCTDNGTEYEITLNLADNMNPVQGTGVGAACDIIDSEQITSNGAVASILKEFTITYSGCVIKCKIDKETKRVTWANYLTPLTIDALASVLISTVDAKVVISFEKDYTITY